LSVSQFNRNSVCLTHSLDGTTAAGNLFLSRLAELMSSDVQLLGQFTVTKHLDLTPGLADQTGGNELLQSDFHSIRKAFQLRDIDHLIPGLKLIIVEASFG